jgi:hypothetical protein
MQLDPNDPKPEPEPADDLGDLLMEAMEAINLADAGAVLLAEAERMAQEED